MLDAHALKLDLCHAKEDEKTSGKTEKGISLTKIIVRNVAFEATEKDLRQLFSTYGQVTSHSLYIVNSVDTYVLSFSWSRILTL